MATTLPSPTSSPDVEDWQAIRRRNIRGLRKQTRSVLLLMALMEALKIGPLQLVYAGRQGYAGPGENDFGLVHTVSYIISYFYICAFMIVFIPLFSWWLPASAPVDPAHPTMTMRIIEYVKQFELICLPFFAGGLGLTYLVYLVQALIYVDDRAAGSRKLPKNSKKNWMARLLLLTGIAITISTGYGALIVLEMMELAKVKTLEYAIIIVPININMGIMLGSRMQMKMEKRTARKEMAREQVEDIKVEVVVDEKAALIEV